MCGLQQQGELFMPHHKQQGGGDVSGNHLQHRGDGEQPAENVQDKPDTQKNKGFDRSVIDRLLDCEGQDKHLVRGRD